MEWCKGRASRRSPFFMVSEKFRFANFPGICYDAEKGVLEKGGLPVPVDRKNVIADTFANMVQRSGLDKITVKALIEECHISRQTFYYHFRDIMDVVEWQQKQLLDQSIARSLATPSFREALQCMVQEAFQHRQLIQQLMASQRRGEIEQLFYKAVHTYLGKIFQDRAPFLALTPTDADTILRFSSWGVVGMMLTDLNRKQPNPDALAQQMYRLLTGRLAVYIPDPPQP